jgi:hypothetical protein
MSHSVFGWSYPPGCSGPPEAYEHCEICERSAENCECPECPVCGIAGDPKCYAEHGLKLPESSATPDHAPNQHEA